VVLPEEFLHENVHKLLPTLHAVVFAIDVTVDAADPVEDQVLFKQFNV
jgi:hypothetical protein